MPSLRFSNPAFMVASPPPSNGSIFWPSFVVGAISASVAWCVGLWIRSISDRIREITLDDMLDIDNDEDEDEEDKDWIKHRIGELPSRIRKEIRKWPWDTIRTKVLTAAASAMRAKKKGKGNGGSSNDDDDSRSKSAASPSNKTGPCIGSIFGLDVGGTLTKLVYFEQLTPVPAKQHPNPPSRSQSDDVPPLSPGRQGGASSTTAAAFKRSASLADLTSSSPSARQAHADALNTFYSFARRFDSHGTTGVKDQRLSYYSRSLQGEFHFVRFETRRMSHALDLMRAHDLHVNIRVMGATGGGAHKYAGDWERELGIRMAKQDEMDSLVAGMQFALSDATGECYTFKPRDWSADDGEAESGGESSKSGAAAAAAVNGAMRRTPQKVLDKTAMKSSHERGEMPPPLPLLDSNNISSGGESSSDDGKRHRLRGPLHRKDSGTNGGTTAAASGGDDGAKEDPRPPTTPRPASSVDEWWTSQKVRRDIASPANDEEGDGVYPYLMVSIGTGVSILRVDGHRKHERISGSTIGGGTYWGLCRLLTGSDSFVDVLNLAMKGDPSKVDMMVGDIYGSKNSDALSKMGLSSNVVASSFGKLVSKADPSEGIREEDLARALLLMVTNNIGQVAHLNARLHGTSRIYFLGTFLQHNTISQQRLAHAIDYWSQGKMEALFLEREGYFGALGAFLLSQGIGGPDREPPRSSRREDDATSSAAASGSNGKKENESKGEAKGEEEGKGWRRGWQRVGRSNSSKEIPTHKRSLSWTELSSSNYASASSL